MNLGLLANSVFKLKHKNYFISNNNLNTDELILPPPPIFQLRRTNRGVDCWNCEPTSSYNLPCRLDGKQSQLKDGENSYLVNTLEVCKSNNQGERYWYRMNWVLDSSSLDIHYWVSSYMLGDYHYTYKYPDTFEIIRLQFSDVLLYCLLKIKIMGMRKIRQRYKRTLLPDTVLIRREHLRSRLGFIMTTSQRSLIRKKIMQFLIGNN